MKRWKVYLCAAVFLLLTAVKMIAPAAAADARKVLLPAINADDDYKSVFAEIRSVFAPAPVQTQDEQLRQYLPAVNMSVWSTPAPEPTPTPTPKPAAGGYILPDSTTRRLTQADVAGLTWEQCCLARNEIYARHGRIFQTPQIAAYFEAQSWYHGTVPGASFDNNTLSPIEHANADFLTSYENATWGHSYY